MTHKDIYIKFMIEYDKANTTSSYPSLTKYEIATILDKAYLAIIAQKVTGNNQRKVGFEADIKAIEDLRPLISNTYMNKKEDESNYSTNDIVFTLPEDYLYYVTAKFITDTVYNVHLIDHIFAEKYMTTANNLPWVPNPVIFFEDKEAHILVDPSIDTEECTSRITYIKEPKKFTSNYKNDDKTDFELSDNIAEELINLAIVFATNIVESSRN